MDFVIDEQSVELFVVLVTLAKNTVIILVI